MNKPNYYEYIAKCDKVCVADVQAHFSLKYSEARKIVGAFENCGVIEPEGALYYRVSDKERAVIKECGLDLPPVAVKENAASGVNHNYTFSKKAMANESETYIRILFFVLVRRAVTKDDIFAFFGNGYFLRNAIDDIEKDTVIYKSCYYIPKFSPAEFFARFGDVLNEDETPYMADDDLDVYGIGTPVFSLMFRERNKKGAAQAEPTEENQTPDGEVSPLAALFERRKKYLKEHGNDVVTKGQAEENDEEFDEDEEVDEIDEDEEVCGESEEFDDDDDDDEGEDNEFYYLGQFGFGFGDVVDALTEDVDSVVAAVFRVCPSGSLDDVCALLTKVIEEYPSSYESSIIKATFVAVKEKFDAMSEETFYELRKKFAS